MENRSGILIGTHKNSELECLCVGSHYACLVTLIALELIATIVIVVIMKPCSSGWQQLICMLRDRRMYVDWTQIQSMGDYVGVCDSLINSVLDKCR